MSNRFFPLASARAPMAAGRAGGAKKKRPLHFLRTFSVAATYDFQVSDRENQKTRPSESYLDPRNTGLRNVEREMILKVVGTLPNLPENLLADLENFLWQWNRGGDDPSTTEREIGGIFIRAYRISELARLPGAPSRSTIYKILRELELFDGCSRCGDGRLAPETVRAILNYRQGPAPCRNAHGNKKSYESRAS